MFTEACFDIFGVYLTWCFQHTGWPLFCVQVLHINHQWDIEYRELQQKFELCQQDMKSGSQSEDEELSEGIRQLELKQQREEELMAELAAMREELDSVRQTKEQLEKSLSGECAMVVEIAEFIVCF